MCHPGCSRHPIRLEAEEGLPLSMEREPCHIRCNSTRTITSTDCSGIAGTRLDLLAENGGSVFEGVACPFIGVYAVLSLHCCGLVLCENRLNQRGEKECDRLVFLDNSQTMTTPSENSSVDHAGGETLAENPHKGKQCMWQLG